MHRIEGSDYDDASGVKLFTEGPPGTVVTQEWLNAVQEELVSLVVSSGQTIKTQAGETRNQLLSALMLGKYYYADASESDQNITATGDLMTIKDCVDEIGSGFGTIVLTNQGTATLYTVASGALSIPSNITLFQQPGARLHFNTGTTGSIAGPLAGGGMHQKFSMADRDSLTYTGPSILIDKYFGSANDNSADDSNAINDMIGAAPAYGKVWITKGTLKVNSVDFDQDDLDIRCDGLFAPFANTGYCVRVGNTATSVARVSGNISVDSNSTYETYDTVIGLEVVNLVESFLRIRSEGCAVGVDIYGNGDACAYNTFYLGPVKNSKLNLRMDARGGAGGYCNQNVLIGGRFGWNSGLNYTGTKHISIIYDATNILNNNIFYGPSFENGDANSKAIDCDGVGNHFLNCRMEMGAYQYQTIHFGSNSARNKFTTAYSDNLIGNAIALPGVINSSDSTSITMSVDPGDRVWESGLLELTIGGNGYNVMVYSSGATIEYAHPCEADTGNLVTAVKALPIYNEGRTNIFELSRVDDSGTSNLGMLSRHEQLMYNDGGMSLRGTGSYIPALALIAGTSAADAVMTIRGFTYLAAEINGRGDFNGYNDSGQSTMEILCDDSNCGKVTVKNAGNDRITLNGLKGCIELVGVTAGTAQNNSIYRDSADNKLKWKDNGGTSHDLY